MPLTGLIGSATILLLLLVAVGEPEDESVWRHLNSGRYIAQSGLPHHDPFTVLGANRPWANPSWLFDSACYLVYVAGGDRALIAARFSLVAVLAILLLLRGRGSGGPIFAIPLLVAVPALRGGLDLTPALAGLVILALFVVALDRWESQRSISSAACLVGVQVLWANAASTFILGPILFACRWLGTELDDWLHGMRSTVRRRAGGDLAVLLAILAGSIASPYGVDGVRSSSIDIFAAYAMDAEGQPLVPGLTPLWSAPWSREAAIAFAILLAVAIIAAVSAALRFRALLPTTFISVLAIADARLMPLAAVWLVQTIQESISDSRRRTAGTSDRAIARTRWLVFAASVAVATWSGLAVWSSAYEGFQDIQRHVSGSTTTHKRLRWLATDEITGVVLPLNLLDAGWIEWGSSKLRPLLDHRSELFAADLATYRQLCDDVVHDRHNTYRRTDESLGGWRRLANALPFDWIVSRASDVRANLLLNSSSHWAPAYWDSEVIVFGRKQHTLCLSAAKRLDELNDVTWADGPGTRGSSSNTLTELVSKDYSQREYVVLAKVYFALERPEIARYCLSRVDSSRLAQERQEWLNRLECAASHEFVVQVSAQETE